MLWFMIPMKDYSAFEELENPMPVNKKSVKLKIVLTMYTIIVFGMIGETPKQII